MSNTTPAVAVLPYGRKLGYRPGPLPLDKLNWPLGQPDRLKGKSLSELGQDDHLIIYPSGTAHLRPSFGTRAKVSMMVVEPAALHGRHLQKLKRSHRRFFRVMSANEAFLATIPNGIFLPFGTTWVPGWRDLDVAKNRSLSLIASSKRDLKGHVLRHETIEWVIEECLDMDIMGRGYRPFENKAEGLAPYRFSVVIENVREDNFFTEKLIDSVLCECIPIYWGCPNIHKFMDTSGMVLCENAEELQKAIREVSEAKFKDLLPGLRLAKEQAAHWADLEPRAARAVVSS